MRHISWALAAVAAIAGLSACSAHASVPKDLHYVALGDSYAAMGSQAELIDPDDSCLVTADGYPELLAAAWDVSDFANNTCQGAVTADVVDMDEDPDAPFQIDAVNEDTDVVTLTIGANDVSAIDVGLCFDSDPAEPCESHYGDIAARQFDALPGLLDQVYAEIHQRAPHARVLATGYLPLIVEGDECAALDDLAVSDTSWLAEETVRLNDEVRRAAECNGATYVMPDHAEQHSGCSTDPWTDFTGEEEGSYPMHPTPDGQRAMADALAATLQ